jgi:hypothetical protein
VAAGLPHYYREDLALVHDRGFGFHAAVSRYVHAVLELAAQSA